MLAFSEFEREFIAAMDANPEFLEVVRSRLLTRELLELPDEVRRLTDTIREYTETTNRRLDAMERDLAELNDIVRRFTESTERRLEALESGQTSLLDSQRRHETDMGLIRGFHAQQVFARRAGFQMQRQMGLRLKSRWGDEEIANLLLDSDTAGVSEDDLVSFEDADALLLATDPEGAERFVAVEISYTAHTEDVDRAVRNAGFLTRWTGLPADSAVAGERLHEAARRLCEETGTVFLRLRSMEFKPR